MKELANRELSNPEGFVTKFFRNSAEYLRDNWGTTLKRGVAGAGGAVLGLALGYVCYEVGPSLLKLPHYQIVTLGLVGMSIGVLAGIMAYSSLKYAVNGPNKK